MKQVFCVLIGANYIIYYPFTSYFILKKPMILSINMYILRYDFFKLLKVISQNVNMPKLLRTCLLTNLVRKLYMQFVFNRIYVSTLLEQLREVFFYMWTSCIEFVILIEVIMISRKFILNKG